MNAERIIEFFNESDTALPVDKESTQKIISLIESGEECRFNLLEIVFVDEQEIRRINEEHLNRTYITDIISFRYDEDASLHNIEGTLFCCAPRIKEQATEYEKSEREEFRRILIHGLLHLVGYNDQEAARKRFMTQKENQYLNAYKTEREI